MPVIAAFLLLAAGTDPVGDCRALTVAKQAGERVNASDTVIVPCLAASKDQDVSLWFDRKAGAALARSAMPAGQPLGHAYFPSEPVVHPGDKVSFSVSLGHVIISREVVAMQASYPGQKFFARAGDGAILVVPALSAQGGQP